VRDGEISITLLIHCMTKGYRKKIELSIILVLSLSRIEKVASSRLIEVPESISRCPHDLSVDKAGPMLLTFHSVWCLPLTGSKAFSSCRGKVMSGEEHIPIYGTLNLTLVSYW